MKRSLVSDAVTPGLQSPARLTLPFFGQVMDRLQAIADQILNANTVTLVLALSLLFSVLNGYWFAVSRSLSMTGLDVLTQPDVVAAALTTATNTATPIEAPYVPFTLAISARLALAALIILAFGAIIAAIAALFHPAFERRLNEGIAVIGLLGLSAEIVYLINMAAAPTYDRHLDYGFWIGMMACIGLVIQITFQRNRLPFRGRYYLFLGLTALLNGVLLIMAVVAEISRSRQPKQSVAFEITSLIGLMLYGGVMGYFLTGNVYRRKGYSVWVGRAIGVVFGAAGNLALLIPLWSRLPAKSTEAKRIKLDELIWGALFLVPWLVGLIVLIVHPMLDSYRVALYNWQGIGDPTQYVGLRHVQDVISDPFFWESFRNTVVYTLVVVPVQLTLTLGMALILNRPNMRLAVMYRTLYFLPVVTSISVVAVVMRLILGNFGSSLSALFGVNPPINPLSSPQLALLSVIGFGIWQSFGVNLVYFLAALQTVPAELYDAAKVDGANWFEEIWNVTLPGIRPILVVIIFLAIIGSMNVFEQSFVLTNGGPYYASQVVAGYIYNYAFHSANSETVPNLGYASAAALFFSMIMLILTAVNYFVISRVRKANA